MKHKISLLSLILLIVAAMDSIRNFPAAALFGSALIFFFIFAAIVFLIPTALVSAELSATFPEKGGVYQWVNHAFGKRWAMMAIWLQWINTMVWYPTILSFIAGTAAYLIDPKLVENKVYLVCVILAVFWTITLLNMRGLRFSAHVNNFCALIGTIFPMLFLIALGAYWYFSGKTSQIEINSHTMFPSLTSSTNWVSLIAIMASFLGMELAGVHVSDIKNPQRNFPKAVLLACLFIILTMIFGSLTIAVVLPQGEINLVAGVMQVFQNFFTLFGLQWFIPILAILIVIGTTGGITNWLISPARGLLHAAEFGFLPKVFMKKNAHDVPVNIMLTQAVLVSIFCSIFFLVPSVNAFYWFLTALSTELYMIMYILMFFAALRLHYRHVKREPVFKIPGKQYGMWTTVLLGLFGCLTTIVVTFFPPTNIDVGTPMRYVTMILIGNAVTLAPILLFFRYQKRHL